MSDDDAIEAAIADLASLVNGEDRLVALRTLGVDEQLLADLRAEARDLLTELSDPEPHLVAVPDIEGDNE
jgi:hypothetical protein